MRINLLALLNEDKGYQSEVNKFCDQYGLEFNDLYLLYREAVTDVRPGYMAHAIIREFLSDLKATLFGEDEYYVEAVVFGPNKHKSVPKVGFMLENGVFVEWSHPLFGKSIVDKLMSNPKYPYWQKVANVAYQSFDAGEIFFKIQKEVAEETLLSWGSDYVTK